MARFTSGWIKLHRSVLEKDIAQNLFLFAVWNYLLLIANYKESQIIWKGHQRILKPGQVLIKIRELSIKWDCSTKTIWKWFHYLHETGRIVLEAETRGTVITICNYEDYQITEEIGKHQVNTEETPSKHQVNYSEEDKKIRNKNIGDPPVEYSPHFLTFWNLYKSFLKTSTQGKKESAGDKKKAFKAFERLKLSEESQKALKQAISKYFLNKEDWRSAQHFSTFLNSDWRGHLEDNSLKSILANMSEEEQIKRGFKLRVVPNE